jgi:RimJ/RimL family protein N-acetyltransferase
MNNSYRCLTKNIFELNSYKLLPLREEDIFLIKDWRNQQVDILRQKKILTEEDQRRYYQDIILPAFKEEQPNLILFSFLLDNKLIGYGGLVYISWQDKRGEVSFLLSTQRTKNNETYKSDFNAFLKLIKIVAFDNIGLNRIYTETFDIRPFHISILEKNGFDLEGRLRQHLFISGSYVDLLFHGFLKDKYVKK